MSELPLVLVTGGSGLLGSALIERLVDDYRIVSLDLEGDPLSRPDVEFICTDLTSDRSTGRAFARVRERFGTTIASVVHLAAYYDFSGEDSPLYEEVTVRGTARLLHALQDFDVGQFVFSSTMLVHEPARLGERISERDPVESSWPYPASKVATERVVRQNHDDIPAVIVRLAGVYDEDGHSPPLTNQIRRIDGRGITGRVYPADPANGQAFVHRDDAADALERIVARRGTLPPEIEFLIGEPETASYGDLQDAIARELHGTDWTTVRFPELLVRLGAWLREQNPLGSDPFVRSWMVGHAGDHYALDIGQAREHLGWTPEHFVLDVIPDMIANLRKDPEGWYGENDLEPPGRFGR